MSQFCMRFDQNFLGFVDVELLSVDGVPPVKFVETFTDGPSSSLRDLRVLLESDMSSIIHVNKVVSECFLNVMHIHCVHIIFVVFNVSMYCSLFKLLLALMAQLVLMCR